MVFYDPRVSTDYSASSLSLSAERVKALALAAMTERAAAVLFTALNEAKADGYIGTGRVLLALMDGTGGYAVDVLREYGVEREQVELLYEFAKEHERPAADEIYPFGTRTEIPVSGSCDRWMTETFRSARRSTLVNTGHQLHGLLSEPKGFASRALVELGVRPSRMRKTIRRVLSADPAATLSREPIERVRSSVTVERTVDASPETVWTNISGVPVPQEGLGWRLVGVSRLDRGDGEYLDTLEHRVDDETQFSTRAVTVDHVARRATTRIVHPADWRDYVVTEEVRAHADTTLYRVSADFILASVLKTHDAAITDDMRVYVQNLATAVVDQLEGPAEKLTG